jgi:hypothetical protein
MTEPNAICHLKEERSHLLRYQIEMVSRYKASPVDNEELSLLDIVGCEDFQSPRRC